MTPQPPLEPPSIVRSPPEISPEDAAVFARMRDLVMGQQNTAELGRLDQLREETRAQLGLAAQGTGGEVEKLTVLYGGDPDYAADAAPRAACLYMN